MKLMLASDVLAALPAGLPVEVREIVRAIGAGDRHRARVASTRAAAEALAERIGGVGGGPITPLAIMTADAIGIGGRRGLGWAGGMTPRTDRLLLVGSGRRHAADGGAWIAALHAAIQEAQETIVPADVRGLSVWAPTEAWGRNFAAVVTAALAAAAAADPQDWHRTPGSAVRARVEATGAEPRVIEVGLGEVLTVRVEGSLDAWASALAEAQAALVAANTPGGAIEPLPEGSAPWDH